MDLNLLIQSAGLLATYLTIFLGVFGNWKKKQQDALAALQATFNKELEELKANHEKELNELKAQYKDALADIKIRLADEHADRVDKTARLHARIDEMQTKMIGDLRSDMSEISGQLKGVSNTINQIQKWFIDQAGQGRGG